MSKVAIQIPIKSTPSVRLPGKNWLLINGEPLCLRLIKEVLCFSAVVGADVYIDSDTRDAYDKIKELLPGNTDKMFKMFLRPYRLAMDTANGNHLIAHFAHVLPHYTFYIQAFVTAINLKAETMIDAFNEFVKAATEGRNDSLVLGTNEIGFFWQTGNGKLPKSLYVADRPNGFASSSQLSFFRESTGMYAITREALFSNMCRVGSYPLLFPISKEEALDIDTWDDLNFAKKII